MSILKVGTISNVGGTKSESTDKILTPPNYSSGTSLTLNVDNTMTALGWVLMTSSNYYDAAIGTINGVEVFHVDGQYGQFEDWNSAMYPVDVGDVVKLTAQSLKFFPCR